MKPFRLGRWGSTVLSPSSRQCCLLFLPATGYSPRFKSTLREPPGYGALPVKAKRGRPKKSPGPGGFYPAPSTDPSTDQQPERFDVSQSTFEKEQLPSPPINTPSSKLAALHARLYLSSRIPTQTLARCLVDSTADSDYRFNNSNFAKLGNDLLGYYISEHLICHYPRLPMVVLTAAMHAYVGGPALASVAEGWGIEVAAEPGGEVDPGLLQFRRHLPTKRVKEEVIEGLQDYRQERAERMHEAKLGQGEDLETNNLPGTPRVVTLEEASRNFVRAVFGAMYVHCGAAAVQEFFAAHILSRHLDLASLFTFTQPTRDLSRLCAREGFESPVARLISETGRLSRHPVFVVGVFSGRDKIGEDAGASLNEARFKAAAKALKGWYLYSPKNSGTEVMVPSAMIGQSSRGKTWQPAYIDDGEIIA